MHFTPAGGHSMSLGLCPTKLPVTWEERTDHPLVPAKNAGAPVPARLEAPVPRSGFLHCRSCLLDNNNKALLQHVSSLFLSCSYSLPNPSVCVCVAILSLRTLSRILLS